MDEQQQRIAALEDLIATLWLYTGNQAWMKLTTEQKELFADVVDADHRRIDEAEGRAPGEPGSFTPIMRWWREDADEARARRLTLPEIATSHRQAVAMAASAEAAEVVVLGCTATRILTGEFADALMRGLEERRVHRVRLHNARGQVAGTLRDAARGRRLSVEQSEIKAS